MFIHLFFQVVYFSFCSQALFSVTTLHLKFTVYFSLKVKDASLPTAENILQNVCSVQQLLSNSCRKDKEEGRRSIESAAKQPLAFNSFIEQSLLLKEIRGSSF